MSIQSILTDINSVQRAITNISNNTELLKKIDNIDLDFVSGFHFVGIGKSLLAANKTAASLRSVGFMSSSYQNCE
jgi:D-arabinose 5-phosphate isomerase GutQ